MSSEWKDALWARFSTGAPARQRRCVERYSIVTVSYTHLGVKSEGLMPMTLDKVPSNQMPSSGLPEAVAMIEREAASHWVDVRDLPELKEARDGGELL